MDKLCVINYVFAVLLYMHLILYYFIIIILYQNFYMTGLRWETAENGLDLRPFFVFFAGASFFFLIFPLCLLSFPSLLSLPTHTQKS